VEVKEGGQNQEVANMETWGCRVKPSIDSGGFTALQHRNKTVDRFFRKNVLQHPSGLQCFYHISAA
jgi:hypothetical protein